MLILRKMEEIVRFNRFIIFYFFITFSALSKDFYDKAAELYRPNITESNEIELDFRKLVKCIKHSDNCADEILDRSISRITKDSIGYFLLSIGDSYTVYKCTSDDLRRFPVTLRRMISIGDFTHLMCVEFKISGKISKGLLLLKRRGYFIRILGILR